ncbi:NADPH-dependent F420 reductase [Arthrobacter sp. KNU-44]|uniref:NADPH-dependent F420 reductase n=1 Tax=Arthrobacter sp. KNU-44 TaxID=3450744 RepID=UPI003F43F799
MDKQNGNEQMSKFAVIGAGTIGGILARKLAAQGHSVKIANSKDPSTLMDFDAKGVTPAWAAEALVDADVAILSLPQSAVGSLSENVLYALSRVPIVVETGNYYPDRDGRIEEIENGLTDSEWVSAQIGRSVFKAFNNIGAMSLLSRSEAAGAEGRIALSVAGPAGPEKQQMMILVDQLGFDPVDGGELKDSWRQQPGSPAYCADLTATELSNRIRQATAVDIPKFHSIRDKTEAVAGSEKQRRFIANGLLR